jgi:Rhodopirellula transposase DDE domain
MRHGVGATRMPRYSPTIEAQMRLFYQSLSEKDRRRYAAIEARKLGRGGLSYIARILSCDRHTIAQGMQELTEPEALKQRRIRRAGGGRKPSHELIPELDTAFLQVLEEHTAGSPMNAAVKWTNLTHQEIADRLAADHGIEVSVTVIKRLLRQHDFVRRKAQKRQRTGECAQRDAQFATIARLKADYMERGNPVLSIDTKKKS